MEIIAGVDEAGRGPLAGPVVASAVILPKDHTIEGLRDSKKLTPKKRSLLYDIIQKEAISIGVGIIGCKEIDKINILQATFKAMQIALGHLSQKPTKALIDGTPLPNQVIPNEGIVGGDDLVDEIKAASIIAKVTRDNLMKEYAIILVVLFILSRLNHFVAMEARMYGLFTLFFILILYDFSFKYFFI